MTHHYHERRRALTARLQREPDELQGFHGTRPVNVLSIAQTGFDSGRRAGQVYGSGEYFAKNPEVSRGYCAGGAYMFVCRLSLGQPSSGMRNADGDHIWVPSQQYYVISQPAQILPQYIVRFQAAGYGGTDCPELSRVLRMPRWSTKRERQVTHVPDNRPCVMSMSSTDALCMGFLHANLTDDRLEADVCAFFGRHAPGFAKGLRVHIASGKFKKAHVKLTAPMPRELVHALNRAPFVEGGKERTICVDDAHGSPEQDCPRWIAGYCRGRNLRYTHSCWCRHRERPTERATYDLVKVDVQGAKGNEIAERFMQSAPFHDGSTPRVVAIHAVKNDTLARLHEEYRSYLRNKNKEEPVARELYHGTNNRIIDVLFTHGLQPPADFEASEACPVSGGKGLCTSLCNNDCVHCVERHKWDRCHMFGLGIYLADLSQKSHRYCSQPEDLGGGRRRFRMVLCSVLGRAPANK
uniref:Poly [ADP-ribose] polymerase n=1 Tax=Zooxanthella nutricula TaxID=1333877 RepID=A0A7S2INF5_9DINO